MKALSVADAHLLQPRDLAVERVDLLVVLLLQHCVLSLRREARLCSGESARARESQSTPCRPSGCAVDPGAHRFLVAASRASCGACGSAQSCDREGEGEGSGGRRSQWQSEDNVCVLCRNQLTTGNA